jgi:hypothetical protein
MSDAFLDAFIVSVRAEDSLARFPRMRLHDTPHPTGPSRVSFAAPARHSGHKLLISRAISRVDLVRLQEGCCHARRVAPSAETPIAAVDNVDIVHGRQRCFNRPTACSNTRP